MTEHQILGLMAFAQVVLTVYGIIEIRRAAGLFRSGVDLVAQAMGDIARQVAVSSRDLAELVRHEGESMRNELTASSRR